MKRDRDLNQPRLAGLPAVGRPAYRSQARVRRGGGHEDFLRK